MDSGKARFVYRHYASLGEESVWAAEAAECASDQGKFWEYHDVLYDNWAVVGFDMGAYSYNNLVGFARILELDQPQFVDCMETRKYLERVRGDSEFAESIGVDSTPTVFINGKHVRGGGYSIFRDAIEAALAGN